jgi:hypothetical protein
MELKLNDVYRFIYNAEWSKKIFEPYWCFDGQLIVKEHNGQLYLEDTYWGSSENKTFTLEDALRKGELTFICNLEDVEKIEKYNLDYYDDTDLFDLSHQHHCYEAFYKKKNAMKSAIKMEKVLIEKIQSLEHDIEYKKSELQRCKEKLEKIKMGNIDIYI